MIRRARRFVALFLMVTMLTTYAISEEPIQEMEVCEEYIEAPIKEVGPIELGKMASACEAVSEATDETTSESGAIIANTGGAIEPIPPTTDESFTESAVVEAMLAPSEETDYTPRHYEMSISKSASKTIYIGDTLQVSVGKGKASSWSSSKEKVASVYYDGACAHIEALAAGTAKITVKLTNKKKYSLTLTVKDPYKPTGIKFQSSSLMMEVGEGIDLSDREMLVLKPAYARTAFTWKTSNKKVAQISKSGMLTAVKPGSATITAITNNNKKATLKVTVMEVSEELGTPSEVTAGLDANGDILVRWRKTTGCDGYKISYYSLNSLYIKSIHVSGRNTQQCIIPTQGFTPDNYYVYVMATVGVDPFVSENYREGTASEKVCVSVGGYIPVTKVTLTAPDTALTVGGQITVDVSVEPSNATNRQISWLTSDKSIAAVENGVVTGLREGTVTLSALSQDDVRFFDEIRLNVVPENNPRPIEGTEIISAKPSDTGITLTWHEVQGATGYTIYYKRSFDSTYSSQKISGGTMTLGILTRLDPGTVYYIHVSVNRGTVESNYYTDIEVRTEGEELPVPDVPRIQELVALGNCIWVKWAPLIVADECRIVCWAEGSLSKRGITIKDLSQTEHIITGLERNKEYNICLETRSYKRTIKGEERCVRTERQASGMLEMGMALDSVALQAGESYQLHVVAKPDDTFIPKCKWSSSNTNVARVNSSGHITAVGNGTATIVATSTSVTGETLTASCPVYVKTPAYRALLIGEATFGSSAKDLPGTKKDVARMKNVLSKRKGASGAAWSIQTRTDRSASQIHSDINSVFGSAKETDVSLFMISTHGSVTRPYEDKYASALTCYNSESSIAVDELADWLGAIKGKVIVIISACGSGGFIAEKPGNTRNALMSAAPNNSFDLSRFNQDFVDGFAARDGGIAVDSNERILMQAGELRGHVTDQTRENKFYVLTSSKFQQLSFSNNDYTYFIKWLSDGVGTSGGMKADEKYAGNKDGKVTLNELYTYISRVGDKYSLKSSEDGMYYTQQVQVYPSGSNFVLFQK